LSHFVRSLPRWPQARAWRYAHSQCHEGRRLRQEIVDLTRQLETLQEQQRAISDVLRAVADATDESRKGSRASWDRSAAHHNVSGIDKTKIARAANQGVSASSVPRVEEVPVGATFQSVGARSAYQNVDPPVAY
jgi:hypothetical protein